MDDLRFIYGIDDKIEYFGYQRDSRIEENLKSRNKRKNLAKIFNCGEDQISFTKKEVLTKKDIIFHFGDFNLIEFNFDKFKTKNIKLPEIIKEILILEVLNQLKV